MYNFSFSELKGIRQVVVATVAILFLSGLYVACSLSKDPKIGDCYKFSRYNLKVTKALQYGAYVDAYVEGFKAGNDYVPYFAMQRIDCYWEAKK